jgi:hypothetical protein
VSVAAYVRRGDARSVVTHECRTVRFVRAIGTVFCLIADPRAAQSQTAAREAVVERCQRTGRLAAKEQRIGQLRAARCHDRVAVELEQTLGDAPIVCIFDGAFVDHAVAEDAAVAQLLEHGFVQRFRRRRAVAGVCFVRVQRGIGCVRRSIPGRIHRIGRVHRPCVHAATGIDRCIRNAAVRCGLHGLVASVARGIELRGVTLQGPGLVAVIILVIEWDTVRRRGTRWLRLGVRLLGAARPEQRGSKTHRESNGKREGPRSARWFATSHAQNFS